MIQCPLKAVKQGDYVKRKADAKTVFVRGQYDRTSRRYSLSDTEDMNREVFLKGDTLVWVGFTY